MDAEQIAFKLSSDRAESDLDKDAFGFGPFAERLATSIASAAPDEGIVLGIYAPWGSGKSTLLNFVERHLERRPEDTRPIVLRFNPWWFSGDEALARHFMGQLEALLDSKMRALGKSLKGKLGRLAETVSAAPGTKFVSIGGTNVKELSESVATSAKGGTKDVVALKKEIAEALRAQDRTILVVVDDVDRLTPEEVRQLFKMVKAVADFPRIVYLLAFDKDVVARALSSQPGVDGAAYLEKIVQVPFELPVPDEFSLGTMFFGRLNEILRDVPQEDLDEPYWNNVFRDGIRHFLSTPRDVVRLSNSLTVTFPAVVGEVNPVDFVAIEAIRVFEPALYDHIRRDPEGFSGARNPRGSETDATSFREGWLAKITPERRAHVEALVERVFPNLGRTLYGAESESRWRLARRVCSREAFPIYFRLSVPAGSISTAQIKGVLATVGDRAVFAALLRDYASRAAVAGGSPIGALLARLEDYTEEAIPTESLETFASVLLETADEIALADEGRVRGMFDLGAGMQVGRLFWRAIRRMPQPERFPFLNTEFGASPSLDAVLTACVVLGQQQGRNGARDGDPADAWLVGAEELDALQRVVIGRVRSLASSGDLLRQRGMPSLLHYWIVWGGGEDEARRWAEGAIEDEEGAVRFVAHFLGESLQQGVGDVTVYRKKTMSLDQIREYVDPDRLADRLRTVVTDRLDGKEGDAVELFLREHDTEVAGGGS